MLSNIISILRKGCKTPKDLSSDTGICVRQIYRYLKDGQKIGQIVKVLPGVYGLSDSLPPSFDEYVSNQKSTNVWMSKNQQHNKTIHNKFNVIEFQVNKKSNDHSLNKLEIVTHRESKMSLRETTILILSIAKLDYSEFELKLAMNKLRDVHWEWIERENVTELVNDARERFVSALQKYGNIEYPIPYFFGILRRMLISSLMRQKQEDYKHFVMEYECNQKAAGGEDVTTHQSTSTVVPGVAINSIVDDVYEVPDDWMPVKELLKSIANQHSVRVISDHLFNRAIRYLEQNGHYAERVYSALSYQCDNDCDGASYLCENIHSLSIVEEAVNKNWRRYKRAINPYKKQVEKSDNQPVHDERYGNFYQLFPDA